MLEKLERRGGEIFFAGAKRVSKVERFFIYLSKKGGEFFSEFNFH